MKSEFANGAKYAKELIECSIIGLQNEIGNTESEEYKNSTESITCCTKST